MSATQAPEDAAVARRERPLSLGVPPLLVFALAAPLVALNVHVQPASGDRPIRLSPWVESVEGIAGVAMVATIALAIVLGRRAQRRAITIAMLAIAQSVLVMLVALPALFFTRGGGLFGDTRVRSYDGPRGQSAHVYSTGFLDGCRHEIYLARGVSLAMDRVAVTRSCTAPSVHWDDRGELVVSGR